MTTRNIVQPAFRHVGHKLQLFNIATQTAHGKVQVLSIYQKTGGVELGYRWTGGAYVYPFQDTDRVVEVEGQ